MLSRGWRFAYYKPGAATSAPGASDGAGGGTVWQDASGRNRSDDVLSAEAASCQRRLGPGEQLRPPGPAYQSCMRTNGWRYVRSSGPNYWKDPNHDGMMCHDIMGGLGESCSNF
jgi:hypothetical protein